MTRNVDHAEDPAGTAGADEGMADSIEREYRTKKASASEASALGKAGAGLRAYLTDWRNLFGHALVGVLFLALAMWAPIEPWIKFVVVACLIVFNVVRMSRKKAAASDNG